MGVAIDGFRASGRHDRGPFFIVIDFVAAEKYEIDRCLVALGVYGYDNR